MYIITLFIIILGNCTIYMHACIHTHISTSDIMKNGGISFLSKKITLCPGSLGDATLFLLHETLQNMHNLAQKLQRLTKALKLSHMGNNNRVDHFYLATMGHSEGAGVANNCLEREGKLIRCGRKVKTKTFLWL